MATNNAINANSTTPLAVVNGGTDVNAVTTAPAATAFAGWDSNKNLSANNLINGYATTATAAGTTVLTVASAFYQFFTGSTTQTVTMPVTSTLVLGQSWAIVNNSTGEVTVQSSGANTITALAAGTSATFTCILTSGTTAASWNSTYAEIGTPVVVSQGGTGDTSFTAYSVICGGTTSTNPLQSVASVGTSGQVLTSNGAGALPTMQTLSATGGLKSFQVFTSGTAATYIRPAGITSILVELVGGGGAGGGALGAASSYAAGGGGGSGGYARLYVPSAASTYTYTVGAGGTAGTAGNNAGNAGGTTTFSASSLQATGGNGGSGSGGGIAAAASPVAGGAAGVGSNGNFNPSGNPGLYGLAVTGALISGAGGSSIYGGGAHPIVAATGTGVNANNYGSGGSGGSATTVSVAGGTGSAGIIIVWEFS